MDMHEKVGELSAMNRDLSSSCLGELRGSAGGYSKRLDLVAEKTFRRGDLMRGTTVSRPSVLKYGARGRLIKQATPIGFRMYVRNIPTTQGNLVIFGMHTIGATYEGTPIIDTEQEGSYTVAHIPDNGTFDLYNPADMKTDLLFTVDSFDLVTVNGQNPVTAQEYQLFDEIVQEFERRAAEPVTERPI